MMEELLFFAETSWPKKTIEDFANNKLCYALLFKRSSEALTGNIDEVVLQAIYGNFRKPPGDENSPSEKLRKELEFEPEDKEPTDQEVFDNVLLGIWAPPNSLTRGSVLKLMFPAVSGPHKMPELKETPLHVVVAYDAFKAKDVMELSNKYPGQVMNYGYFSSDVPGEAALLAKTTDKFDSRTAPITYEEKIVIQLAKVIPECYFDFNDLGPSYISRDVDVGEKDSMYFFPPDYNQPEVEIINFLKKKTKRKGKFVKASVPQEAAEDGATVPSAENAPEAFEASRTEAGIEAEGEEATINEENLEEENEEEDELLEGEGKEEKEEVQLTTNGRAEETVNDNEIENGNEKQEENTMDDSADKATSPVNEH